MMKGPPTLNLSTTINIYSYNIYIAVCNMDVWTVYTVRMYVYTHTRILLCVHTVE